MALFYTSLLPICVGWRMMTTMQPFFSFFQSCKVLCAIIPNIMRWLKWVARKHLHVWFPKPGEDVHLEKDKFFLVLATFWIGIKTGHWWFIATIWYNRQRSLYNYEREILKHKKQVLSHENTICSTKTSQQGTKVQEKKKQIAKEKIYLNTNTSLNFI